MLPVHGFVLAGGMSSRMGRDKALLELQGRPLVEIAVEKLRTFCAQVSIAGNREDLNRFAPVIQETRVMIGPAAGIEAGLRAATQPWVVFIPVDVPMVPEKVLQNWVEDALGMAERGLSASYLIANDVRQPAFCLFRADVLGRVTEAIEEGRRRLNELVDVAGIAGDGFCVGVDASFFNGEAAASEDVERWFANVNTPEELAPVERWLQNEKEQLGGSWREGGLVHPKNNAHE
jgi:molybdopterin-guanine dinucleotide biosynthesis protein A